MIRCSRCCLHKSLRILNVVVNFLGMVMIIYSLWLLKKWVDEPGFATPLPKPWFIYTCLGIGIVVCFTTLSGHVVANSFCNSTLAVYIASICSLLLIQAGVIVTIFFKINWESQFNRYIDGHHTSFKTFILFHLITCRLITIVAFLAQINVVVLAVILWSVRGGTRISCCTTSVPTNFTYSFLADYNSPVLYDDPGTPPQTYRAY